MASLILCVDDNENMGRLYPLIFQEIGTVEYVPKVKDALERISQREYDLIISGCHFNRRKEGLELFEALRGRERPYRFMFSSDPNLEELHQRVQESGGLGCIEKLLCTHLDMIVREVLEQGKDSPLLQTYLRERYGTMPPNS